MATADLAYAVHIAEEDGTVVSFLPGGCDVPDWALTLMGDHCFVDGKRPASKAARAATSGKSP